MASNVTYDPATGMNTFTRDDSFASAPQPETSTPWRPTLAPRTDPNVSAVPAQQPAARSNIPIGGWANAFWNPVPQNQPPTLSPTQRAQTREAPPQNPREALDYQWYASQDQQRRQEEMFNQAMEALTRQLEESRSAWGENQQRNEGLMREGMDTQRQDYTQSQQRNEGLMREGMQAQQEEAARVAAQNQQMMRQKQATLQHYFSLLNQGGSGSLAAITSPLASQMGESWNMGMETPTQLGGFYQGMQDSPFQSGGYFSNMMGQADPSSNVYGSMAQGALGTQFGAPDMSLWMDPEAYRTGWVLPTQTMGPGDSYFGSNGTRMTNYGVA